MDTVNVYLGLEDEIIAGIKSGRYYRDGGVIRNSDNAQIVDLLRDVDVLENRDLPGFDQLPDSLSVLPQAVMACQMSHISEKLEKIEALINLLRDELKESKRRVEAIHIKLDSKLFGEIIGSISNCQIAIDEGRISSLPEYRAELVKKAWELKLDVAKMTESAEHVRFYPEEARLYGNALLMAETAIRDISLVMGENKTAEKVSSELLLGAIQLKACLEKHFTSPDSLFWMDDVHRTFFQEQAENIHILENHREQVGVLLSENKVDEWKNRVYQIQTSFNRMNEKDMEIDYTHA